MRKLILYIFTVFITYAAYAQQYTIKDTTVVNELIGKARKVYREDPVAALNYCEEALAVAQQTKSGVHIGKSYNSLGIMNNMMGNADTAIIYFEKAFEYLKSAAPTMAYGIKLNIAEKYFENGRVLTAFEYMHESMDFFDSIDDTYGRVVSRMNIARLYSRMNKYDVSRKFYKESIEINEGKDTGLLIQLLVNLGASYLDEEMTDSAYIHISRAEKLAIIKNQNYDLISICLNLGDIFQIKKEYSTAKDYYNRALKLNRQFGINHYTAFANARLCRLFFSTNRLDSAVYYGKKAETIAESIDDLLLLEELYNDMHNLMDSIGNATEAHEYLHKFVEVQDSIRNQQVIQKVEQYKYELSLADKEQKLKELEEDQKVSNRIILYQRVFGLVTVLFLILLGYMAVILSKRSALYKTANTELEKTNLVKNKVLATISHDLRSPLTSLFSLVNLSNRNLLPEEEAKNLYKTLEKKLSGTMVIVDNLLYWSKNQIAEIKPQLSEIDINSLIADNIELYSNIAKAKKVTLITELDETRKVWADSVLINLVVRNLLSNAIKYTKAKGVVNVSTVLENDKVTISIKDTGLGIAPDVIKQLFTEEQLSRQGTNDETGTGLGLLVSYEFVKMHNSTLKVESIIGEGTNFYFSLPTA